MPYKEHTSAGELPPEGTVIWRFMSLAKFLSLVTRSSLHFAQAKVLTKLDPFEGSLALPNRLLRERIASDPGFARAFFQLKPEEKLSPDLINFFSVSTTQRIREIFRATAYINCWHMSEHETAFLWSNYSSNVDGIAVRSTVKRLCAAISGVERAIYIGPVRYIDYKTEAIDEWNTFNPFFLKRKSFEPEQELRAVFSHELNGVGPSDRAVILNPPGISVPCNLTELIEAVVVSPLTPDWYSEAVSGTLEAMGMKFPIEHSAIAGPAIL